MNDSQKMILLSYFNNEETMKFMCNDFFEELKSVIDINLIYSDDNINDRTRAKNREKLKEIIINFLKKNEVYYSELKRLYNTEPIIIIDDIIDAFLVNSLANKIDIFKDKKSLFYKGFY